jgi:hypothetical protein
MTTDFQNVMNHVIGRMRETPVKDKPFPHFFVENIFPDSFYTVLLNSLPDPECMIPGAKGYENRRLLNLGTDDIERITADKRTFWEGMQGWLLSADFLQAVCDCFSIFMQKRFDSIDNISLRSEAIISRDQTNYQLGPHTDVYRKVISMLFYLPPDDTYADLGTSIYVPDKMNEGFRCKGDHSYQLTGFDRLATIPFLPNTLFAFFKTDNSFHGVEKITVEDPRRDVIMYNIVLTRKLDDNLSLT